jgi:hypothetical protein
VLFTIAFTPVDVLGCRNRGLLTFTVWLISGVFAIDTAIIAIKTRILGDSQSLWGFISTLILTVAVAVFIVLA